ncbi:MAG: hypothetical protein LBR11_01775 [Deltaproteobacteria bacterium]|jgi:hypothetical protein|nr:hypothetical protein [Deltaproteobacteria bacterium]
MASSWWVRGAVENYFYDTLAKTRYFENWSSLFRSRKLRLYNKILVIFQGLAENKEFYFFDWPGESPVSQETALGDLVNLKISDSSVGKAVSKVALNSFVSSITVVGISHSFDAPGRWCQL